MTSEGGKTCPVCTEEMDLTDLQLKPCKCGYEVCVWCWHHIMDMAEKDGREGRCPACRTPYDKEKIVSTVASVEINSERKPKLQKAKSRTYEGRKHLNDVRVLQRHLVYTMGIPANLADEDVLQRREYFGQYGKVLKASLTRTSAGAVQYSTNNTCSVYITYSNEDEAVRCIQSVHGYILQGQPLRACFGTTKYCHTWLRNMPCSNQDCVYLHDVGNQEDSFTKDEIVSAYTRSRVQQITGTTNNLERQSGNALPPPVDESCFTGTASSKPISQSPSDDPPSLLKNSPPNSSSGRSISLPAAASWGLRGSNGHPPTPSSACPNGFSKQHGDSNGVVGFPSLAANTTPVSILHNDVGKKAWVTNDDRASHSSRELGSSDSKRYGVENHQQKIMSSTERVVVQDASPSVVSSRNMPCLDTSSEDNFIKNSRSNACFVRNDLRPSDTSSDKNDNIAVNGKVQIRRPELSSVDIDSYLRNGHSDAIEPNPSVSNQLVRSFSNLGLQQSYPGHNRESLSLLPPRKMVTYEGVFASSVASNLVSKPQFQDLQDTLGAREDDLLAPAEQNSNTSETGHLLQFPLESGSINISSSSNGHSWPYDNGCGTTESFSNDHRSMQTKVVTLSNSVLSNGYTEKNVSISARLEKIFEQPNVFSSVGKYEGSNTTNHFEKKTSVDMGESSIISDILSMDFDPWDDTLASPHNVAKLLGEPDKQFGCLKTSTSKKEQSSNQSRFSFAREVDVTDQGTVPDLSRNTTNRMNTDYVSQLFQDNHEIHSDELPSGLPSEFSESSDTYYGGNISSNRFPVSRPPASAPPGFSVPGKIPPPGFQERINNVIDATPVNHYHGGSSLLRSQYPIHPTMRNFNDLELIDPAILAVGAGRPSNGINVFGLDIRSTPTPRTGAYENDPTMELLMQQYLSPSQGFRYPDHIGARFSPTTDAYNTSLRFLDQSQFGQLSFQPKTEHFSHGWNNWNQTQNRNDLGFNQYFSEYENRNSYVPTRNDIYNKAFGM